jgi:hypothetical protein
VAIPDRHFVRSLNRRPDVVKSGMRRNNNARVKNGGVYIFRDHYSTEGGERVVVKVARRGREVRTQRAAASAIYTALWLSVAIGIVWIRFKI